MLCSMCSVENSAYSIYCLFTMTQIDSISLLLIDNSFLSSHYGIYTYIIEACCSIFCIENEPYNI